MAPGSVIIDMGASALGGNVQGSQPGETVVTENGVTIVGASDLPSSMAAASSAMYARNISALLQYLVSDGALAIDLSDELQAGVVITRDGQVVHPALAEPAAPSAAPSAGPQQPAGPRAAEAADPELADSAGGTARVDGPAH